MFQESNPQLCTCDDKATPWIPGPDQQEKNMITYSFLADLTVFLHALFVLFVVLGQLLILLGWWRNWQWTRNRWFRYSHLVAIGYVVFEAWMGITCPLTLLEDYLRMRAGEVMYSTSFIGYWLHYFLFYSAPEWVFTLTYSGFGLLVLLSLWKYPPSSSTN